MRGLTWSSFIWYKWWFIKAKMRKVMKSSGRKKLMIFPFRSCVFLYKVAYIPPIAENYGLSIFGLMASQYNNARGIRRGWLLIELLTHKIWLEMVKRQANNIYLTVSSLVYSWERPWVAWEHASRAQNFSQL